MQVRILPTPTALRRRPVSGPSVRLGSDRRLGEEPGRGAKSVRLVRALPCEVAVVPPEMPVRGSLRVDRTHEVEVPDDRPRPKVEMLVDELLDGRDGHGLG